jgi:adenosine deaminase
VLHDHIDGGLRVATILELADAGAYHDLPTNDPGELAAWFDQSGAGSLEHYLDAFGHTVGVLQTAEALHRAAYEWAVDLAGDAAVYAEARFGPSLHIAGGMRREDAIEAVVAGVAEGCAATGLVAGVIVTALRNADDSEQVALAAARFAGDGVVGFDLAGPEAGFPADLHLPAVNVARRAGLGITIHAGEGDGLESIWKAVGVCGAARIGHGARIVDDVTVVDGEVSSLGRLARVIRDQRIPLELCITSNVHTGLARTAAEHPFGLLHRAGFVVTLNTDGRLMSAVTLSEEYALAHALHGLSLAELGSVTVAAIEAGFGDWQERRSLIEDVVHPAYAAASA